MVPKSLSPESSGGDKFREIQVLHRMINKGAAESQGKNHSLFTGVRTKGGRSKTIKKKGIFKLGSEGLFEVGSDKGRGSH